MNNQMHKRVGLLVVIAAALAILSGCEALADIGVKSKGVLPEATTDIKLEAGKRTGNNTADSGDMVGKQQQPETPEKPNRDPQVELDAAEYIHTRWFLRDEGNEGGDCSELLYIEGLNQRGIAFDLQVPARPGPVIIETDGLFSHTDTELTDSYAFVLDAPDEPGGSISGSIRLEAGGQTVTLEVEAADGVFAPCIGSHQLVNAADDYYVQRSIYRNLVLEFAAAGAGVDSYCLYDLDQDGSFELLAQSRGSDGLLAFDVYTIGREGLVNAGWTAAGSLGLYRAGASIYRATEEAGIRLVYQISLAQDEICETLLEDSQLPVMSDGHSSLLVAVDMIGLDDLYRLDGVVGAGVIYDFFALFAQGDYAGMSRLTSGSVASWDFSQGVFGMGQAQLEYCQCWGLPLPQTSYHGALTYLCVCEITPAEASVYTPDQGSIDFFIVVEQVSGQFLITAFNTSP